MAFPQDPNDVDIELFYDATWNNIDSDVFHRDGNPITISRGRANEGKRCDPGKLSLSLNNRDGKYSPRNPNSPLYGKIGRATPIRVKVTYGATTYIRFTGEVTSWPSRWDVSGRDVWVPLEAAGILRRLGQGKKPLRPPVQPAIEADSPYRYWTMEDGPDSTQFASGLPGGTAVIPAGVEFAAIPGAAGAGDAGPSFVGGTLTIPMDLAGPFAIEYLVYPAGDDDGDSLFGFSYTITGSSTPTNIGITAPTYVDPTLEGSLGWHHVLVTMEQSGADIILRAWFDGGEVAAADHLSATLDRLVRIDISGASVDYPAEPWGITHLAVYASASAVDAEARWDAVRAFDGESTTDRLARVCATAGITFSAPYEGGALVGPQRPVSVIASLRDPEDVDQGFLFELREQLGLTYRTNASKYNQVAVPISYTTKGLGHPLDPEPDDLGVANDREVKRRNGSSARRELASGPLSIQDPPDGVGRVDDSITIDAYSDDQLDDIANWRLHVGTWDAERYPRVRIDLSANPALISDIVPLDSGDYITITDLPSWLPPGDAELLIEGYREVIGFYDWDITFNCSPAGPYNVVGVWGLMAHELHAAINSSTTSVDIANTDTSQPMLKTSGLGSGYGVTVGAEEMQLTAVADSLVTFGATGSVSSGGSGSRTPGLPTSSASGNLIFIFASTRNSGTGVPDTPTNWTRLPIFHATANCQVFCRIYDGVWTMPTVTFTAGAANEDTIAQSMRLAGKFHDASKVLIASAQCLNTSAQNITVPGLPKPTCDNAIILGFGWKQDDWSSSATRSGFTEIAENTTTTGNDAGQVWDYAIQTTATSVAATAFTITGGASGISRGAIAAIRCDYQTATVTRSTNGVSASHSAGDDVTLTRPMRWGLI